MQLPTSQRLLSPLVIYTYIRGLSIYMPWQGVKVAVSMHKKICSAAQACDLCPDYIHLYARS